MLRDNRGWTVDEWHDAADRLRRRGLLTDGTLTGAGRRVRAEIESITDSLALAPLIGALGHQGADRLIDLLTPCARSIADSGELPYPNPIGLAKLSGVHPAVG